MENLYFAVKDGSVAITSEPYNQRIGYEGMPKRIDFVDFQYNFIDYKIHYPDVLYYELKKHLEFHSNGFGRSFDLLSINLFEKCFYNTDSIETTNKKHNRNDVWLHEIINDKVLFMPEFVTCNERMRFISIKEYFSKNIPDYINKYGNLTVSKLKDLPCYYVANISFLFQMEHFNNYHQDFSFNYARNRKSYLKDSYTERQVNNRLKKLSNAYTYENIIKNKLIKMINKINNQ